MQQLNNIYRQVIYITGVAPDQYRDYQLTASLPKLEGELRAVQADIDSAIAALEKTAGNDSDKLTVLRTMSDQLDELIEDQERFTEVLSSFKTNVRACGNWITQVLAQPLQVDRFYIHAADTQPKLDNSSWWESLAHETERLYYSFIIDYNKVGNVAEGDTENVVLTLWIGTGRDQANVIKSLIDEKFTPATGISVNVQLVDMNTLLRATLAGEGPDVAIQVANTNGIAGAVLNTGNDTPVNYGLRNAVLDLTQFEDFPEIAKRFNESAIIPFSFDGATYALPDTQTWLMMFYRKDILAEIGLEVPQTWDEVKVAMSILSKNQMEFDMLPSEQVFAMLLFQNGGRYYTDDNAASALDEDVAINVFKKYCEYYTDYKLDKETSAEERFRTGECPIIISDYTTYNNLQVSAPDILGLWDFTTVPGTVQADGSIDRSTGYDGSGGYHHERDEASRRKLGVPQMVDEHRDADALRARDGIADGGIRARRDGKHRGTGEPVVAHARLPRAGGADAVCARHPAGAGRILHLAQHQQRVLYHHHRYRNEQHHPARGADGQGVLHQRRNQLQAHGIRSAAPSDGRHDEGGVR